MRGSGNSTQAPNTAAREAYQQSVRGLREIPLDELSGEFSVDEVLAVDRYQRSVTDLGKLAVQPYPKEFRDVYGESANMLADNTTTYDDEGEDLLVEDDIIQNIMLERNRTQNPELTMLFRVRRSVVAFILAHWNTIEASERPRRAG